MSVAGKQRQLSAKSGHWHWRLFKIEHHLKKTLGICFSEATLTLA